MALWGTMKAEKQHSAFLAVICNRVRLVGFDKMVELLAEAGEGSIETANTALRRLLDEAEQKGVTANDCMFYVLTTNNPSKHLTVTMDCPGCKKPKNVSDETKIFRCECGLEKAFELKVKRI